MSEEARRILYNQLLEMNEANLIADAEELISEEDFFNLSDEECFKYIFWYRDTQTQFEEDEVYVIELPDINLKGKNLTGLNLSFFQIGIQDRENKRDNISSVNLEATGANINLSTLLYNSNGNNTEIVEDDFFDFSKSNFKGCNLYGMLQGKSKKSVNILGEENLDERYLNRRNRFNSEEAEEDRKVADKVYTRLIQKKPINRVLKSDYEISLSDYEFPFLNIEDIRFIQGEVGSRKIDLYHSDLYQKYGIVNSYSIKQNFKDFVVQNLGKIAEKFSRTQNTSDMQKEIEKLISIARADLDENEFFQEIYNRAKEQASDSIKSCYLEYVCQMMNKNIVTKEGIIDGKARERKEQISYGIIEDAFEIGKQNNSDGKIFREFLYRYVQEKSTVTDETRKILDLAYEFNEDDKIKTKGIISSGSLYIILKDLDKYYSYKNANDLENAQITLMNIKKQYAANPDQYKLEVMTGMILKEKDYDLLKYFFEYANSEKIIKMYLDAMYNPEEFETDKIRKMIRMKMDSYRNGKKNPSIMNIILKRAVNEDDFTLIGENITTFYIDFLRTQTDRKKFIKDTIKRASSKKETEEVRKKCGEFLTFMMSEKCPLSVTVKEDIVALSAQTGWNSFVRRYYKHLKNRELQEKFVNKELDRYEKLKTKEEKKLFLSQYMVAYGVAYGETAIDVFVDRIKENSEEERECLKEILVKLKGVFLSPRTIDKLYGMDNPGLSKLSEDKMTVFSKLKYGIIPDVDVDKIIKNDTSTELVKDYVSTRKREYEELEIKKNKTPEEIRRQQEIKRSLQQLLKSVNKDSLKKEIILTLYGMGDSETLRNYMSIFSVSERNAFAMELSKRIEANGNRRGSESLINLYKRVVDYSKISKLRNFSGSNEVIDGAIENKRFYFLRQVFDSIDDVVLKQKVLYSMLLETYNKENKDKSEQRKLVQKNYKSLKFYISDEDTDLTIAEIIVSKKDYEFFRNIEGLEDYPVENLIVQFEDFFKGKDVDIEKVAQDVISSNKVVWGKKKALIEYLINRYNDVKDSRKIPSEIKEKYNSVLGELLSKFDSIEHVKEVIDDEKLQSEIIGKFSKLSLLMAGIASDEDVKLLLEEERIKSKIDRRVHCGQLLQRTIFEDYPLRSILQLINNGADPNYYDFFVEDDRFADTDEFGKKIKVKIKTPVIIDALELKDEEKREAVVKALLIAGAKPNAKVMFYRNGVLDEDESETARSKSEGLIDSLLKEIKREYIPAPEKVKQFAEALNWDEATFRRYDDIFFESTQKRSSKGGMRLSELPLEDLKKKKAIYDMYGVTSRIFKKYSGAALISPETAYNRIMFISKKTRTRLGPNNFIGEVLTGNKKFALKYGKLVLPDEEVKDDEGYFLRVRDKIAKFDKMPDTPEAIIKKLKEIKDKDAR